MFKPMDPDFQMFFLAPLFMFTPTQLHLSSLAAVAVQFTFVSSCSQEREAIEMGNSWLWLWLMKLISSLILLLGKDPVTYVDT